jgi:hypothetical protein
VDCVKIVNPSLTPLFFVPYGLFHITDGTLVLAKDGDSTSVQISVQKLMVVYISATKHPLKFDISPKCHISLIL